MSRILQRDPPGPFDFQEDLILPNDSVNGAYWACAGLLRVAVYLSEEKEGASWPKQEIRSKARSPARIVFLKTARDTNGELLQFDDFMQGGGHVPIEHVHPYMEERFEVISGTLA